MAITISVPAAKTAMTTIGAIKQTMDLTDTAEYDGLFDRLIKAATDALQEYSGKVYARQTYIETLAGTDSPMLILSRIPVFETPSIIIDSEPIVDFVVQDKDKGELYRDVGWVRTAWVGWNVERYIVPGTDKLTIQVTYDAGYLMPGVTNSNFPAGYEEACIRTVVAWMRQDQRGGIDVRRKRVGELELEFFDQGRRAMAIPPDARSLIGRSAI